MVLRFPLTLFHAHANVYVALRSHSNSNKASSRALGRNKSRHCRYQMECILSRAWLQENQPEVFAAIVAKAEAKYRPRAYKVPKTTVRVKLQLGKSNNAESKLSPPQEGHEQ